MVFALPDSQMFFIVGRGRSGTTLLSDILNRSTSVCVAPESLFVMNLYNKYCNVIWNEADIRNFYSDLWLEGRMADWALDREGLLEWLLEFGTGTDFPTVCRIVYARHAHDSGKNSPQLLGDKNPHYALFADKLADIYQTSKFVYLVRGYLDNITSYRQMKFDTNNVPALAYRWRYYNDKLQHLAESIPDRCLKVRYEELIADPGASIQAICDFLEVGFSHSMLERDGSKGGLEVSWHRNLGKPINSDRLDSWKESLATDEVAAASAICSELATRCGYHEGMQTRTRLTLIELLGMSYGWLLTHLELLLFRLPMRFRATTIRVYRASTGTHTLAGERRS